MYEITTIVLVLVGAFAVVGGVAYILQNRAKKEGNLFSRPVSPSSRIVALILGLIFAGFFWMEITYAGKFHIVMPILAVLLIAYSLGLYRIVENIQKSNK